MDIMIDKSMVGHSFFTSQSLVISTGIYDDHQHETTDIIQGCTRRLNTWRAKSKKTKIMLEGTNAVIDTSIPTEIYEKN